VSFLCLSLLSVFSSSCYGAHRDLHSFPTRRSSDLADGVVSSQSVYWRDRNPGLTTGWEWVADADGSRVIAALQARIGMAAGARDGKIGPETISALQRHLGTPVDGVISHDSLAVMELQRRLNAGRV